MEIKDGYRRTEVGVIPTDWVVVPVGAAFDICNTLRMPISRAVREKMTGIFPYYGPTSIQGYINEYRVEGEYALIGEDGDHFLKWQNQSMTQLVTGRFNVNNHAHLIKGTKNLTAWFYYYFSHRDITPYLTRQGAGRYKLTKNTLIGIPCALPPTKAEQNTVAEALKDADAFIESLEHLLTKKRDIKQGAMQELLTGKKRLLGFIGEWKPKRLGELGNFFSGGTPNTAVPEYYGGNIPWITSSDCNAGRIFYVSGRITSAGVANSATKWIKTGTLLIALYGATAGVVAISGIDATINQAVLAIELYRDDSEFMFQKLVMMKDWIISTYTQGGQPNLSGAIVKSIEIVLPEPQEQSAIASVLSDMDSEIAAIQAKLDKARLMKQGMMQQLLTGRIRLV